MPRIASVLLLCLSSVVAGGFEGTVVDDRGRPLPGAEIVVARWSGWAGYDRRWPDDVPQAVRAKSGRAGAYRVDGLEPGLYRVAARVPDRPLAHYGDDTEWRATFPVRVDHGARTPRVDFRVQPGFRVRGVVRDSAGKPIPDVLVAIDSDTFTNEKGEFRIGPLPVRKSVRAWFSGLGYVFPRFELRPRPGETIELPDVRALAPATLHGVLVDSSGRPVAHRDVRFHADTVTTDWRGRFEFADVAPRSANLVADAGYGKPPLTAAPIALAPGSTHGPVTLRLGVPRSIRGVVKDRNGRPVAGVEVRALSAARVFRHSRGDAETRTDAAGRFELKELQPGQYRVVVPAPWHEAGAVVAPGANVEIVLACSGTVRGRLLLPRREDAPRPRMEIVCRDRQQASFRCDLDKGNPDYGTFVLRAYRPGRYRVRYRVDGHADGVTRAVFLDSGVRIDLGQIELKRAGRIRGRVRGSAGELLRHAKIHVVDATGALYGWHDTVFSDTSGEFILDRLPPGAFTVFAMAPGHPVAVASGVRTGDEVELVVPARSAAVEVTVRDHAGKPLEGVGVEVRPADVPIFLGRDLATWAPRSYGDGATRANGLASLRLLRAGRTTVAVRGIEATVELRPGERRRLEFRVRSAE